MTDADQAQTSVTTDAAAAPPPSAPPAAPVATDPAAPATADTSAGQAAATSDEQAPQPTADDPLQALHEIVSKLADVVSNVADQANEIAKRVEALEAAGASSAHADDLKAQVHDLMHGAMKELAAEFADLPAKIRAIEGKIKHAF